ncbi:MAG TPA: hypothetical protein VIQ30_04890 [Pseudonocardia sp.]
MDNDPYVLCGDCQHCAPTLYDGDDECGPDCHPGIACIEKTRAQVSE